VKVVILCGGKGTRLREETEVRPKPMVEIGGKPIVWHIMKHYAQHGFRDFVLCLGYKGDVIKDYFLNYHAMRNDFTVNLSFRKGIVFHDQADEENWNVTLADTGEDTLTAERIARVGKYIGNEPFMVTYGDGLSDVDVGALVKFHKAQGRMATLTGVRDVTRWGTVDHDGAGGVTGFKEKPQVQDRINAGFFVFEPEVLDRLEGETCMLEEGPLPAMAASDQVSIYAHDGFWHCMDTYRDYVKLNEMWDEGAPWASGYRRNGSAEENER